MCARTAKKRKCDRLQKSFVNARIAATRGFAVDDQAEARFMTQHNP